MRLIFLLLSGVVFCAVVSLDLGAATIPPDGVIAALFGRGDPRWVTIVQEIRLPRMVLSLCIGGVLGLSGAVLQGLLRNPLAEPGLIGTSSAAGLGAVVALYFGWSAIVPGAVAITAMGTAALATLLLLLVTRHSEETLTLILGGIAVSSLAVALTSLAMSLSPNPFALSEMVLWLLGSLKDRSQDDVALAGPFMAAGAFILLTCARPLDALTLGEDTAASLGVSLHRLRITAVLGTSLAVGGAVSVSGTIGFVGLVIPHLLRPLTGYRPSALLIPSACGGAILLTLADALVRLLPTHGELMLGVVTALIGAPFFLFLIVRQRIAS